MDAKISHKKIQGVVTDIAVACLLTVTTVGVTLVSYQVLN